MSERDDLVAQIERERKQAAERVQWALFWARFSTDNPRLTSREEP